ncbi:hypothetical protein CMV_011192 [Castanea mollissima]|uniref:PGG domain-containing protein n=1 Tax=Castanea mollissima TaxID=60419 RepID=A0A8J4RHY0_9ROSI|nr:hypothetical protein CMV_011192 [Castanea mollissima]
MKDNVVNTQESKQSQLPQPPDPGLYDLVAKSDDVSELEKVLRDKGLTLDQVSPSGNSLLHEAAKFGRIKIAEHIIKHFPCLLTKENIIGDSVLHVAVKAGKIDITKDVTDSSRKKMYGGSSEEPKHLVEMTNHIGNTALHEAVIANRLEEAKCLLSVNPKTLYSLNNEGKSPFFIAIENGSTNMCQLLFQTQYKEDLVERPRGELPVYAAILKKRIDILRLMVKERPSLFNMRDIKGRTPLHFAASTGYFVGIKFLLDDVKQSALERSKKGDFPIHTACKKGHVEIVELLKKQWRDPIELLNQEGQNILQVAAKSGRNNVVKHLLKSSQSFCWDAKDKGGNTALHLAATNLHPDVILSLTRGRRVNVKVLNGEGLTAIDIVHQRVRNPSFRKLMTLWALKSAGTPTSKKRMNIISSQSTKPKRRRTPQGIKDYVTLLSVIAVLVATVSFASGLTVPGGFNSSDCGPAGQGNEGMATLANKTMFQVFIISDTVAMYCSIIGAFVLLWSHIDDMVLSTLTFAQLLLQISVFAMCLAFMSAVYLVVSEISWLSIAVWIMGGVFLTVLLAISFMWMFPFGIAHPFFHCICQFTIPLMLRLTEALDHKQENSQPANNDNPEDSQPEKPCTKSVAVCIRS